MALVVNTNVASLNAQRQLNSTTNEMSTAMERLSSGSRINTAADDAAGLSIVTRMDSQVKGLNMAIRNANDGISLAQTAEGAMEEVTSMLQRMRELSVQASNSLNTDADRTALNDEVQQLKAEVDRIATDTRFNNQAILNGSLSTTIQIGDQVSQSMSMAVGSLQTAAMGETTTGPATAATMASLSASGASSTAADYQGKTFSVTTNGVAETVDLPSATTTVAAAATAATSTAAVNGADRAVAGSSSAQIGEISERTIDVSTAANGQLKLTVNSGTEQTIDIASQITALGYTNTAITGTELVTALQNAIDENGTYVGANAVTVSLDSNDQVQLALTSGAAGTIAVDSITEGTGSAVATGLLTTLGGSHLGETSSTGTLVLGGSSTPRTLDLSGSASNTKLGVAIAGVDIDGSAGAGATVDFDIAAEIVNLGYDVSALTATEFGTALKATLEAATNINTVAVSHLADGTVRLTFDDALAAQATLKTDAGSVSLEDGGASGTLIQKLNTGSAEVNGSGDLLNVIDLDFFKANQESFGVADLEISTGTVDLSSTSSTQFTLTDGSADVDLDLGAAITSLGYTDTAMTGAQVAAAMELTINTDSNFSGYTVTADSAGVITVVDTTPAPGTLTLANADSTPTVSGTLFNALGVASLGSAASPLIETGAAGVDTIAFTSSALAKNDDFTLAVNGGSSVELTVAASTYDSFTELAAAVQTSINDSNAFTGDFAVTVSAGTDSSGNHGLVFENAAGKQMTVSGGLVTQTLGISSQLNDGTKIIDSDNAVTVNASDYSPQAGLNGARLVDLSGTEDLMFSVTVNGITRDIDLGSVAAAESATNFIRSAGATSDATITGDQLVAAINAAFDANADIQGDNDITASIDSTGSLQFAVSGGAQTLVVGLHSTSSSGDGLIEQLTTNANSATAADSISASSGIASTGQLATAAGNAVTEVFGENDITISSASNDGLTITVGDRAAVAFTLTAAAYDNVAALATHIQSVIDDSGNFTGAEALTVSSVTNSDGNTGFQISSADGQAVKITGTLTTVNTFTSAAGVANKVDDSSPAVGVTFPAARAITGGVDLSSDNQVQMAVTKADGSVISRTITLGGSDANTSFSDYASLLQTAANSAFAGDSLSFTAGVTNGSLSVALDQAGANSINLSGTSVTDIASAAMTASGTAATVDSVGTPFSSMADVVSAMNDDLSNASVSYSAASGFTFTATSGSAGAANTIEIAGDDLADVQMTAGSATGADGNATAAALSTITVDTTANAAAAIGSIDNAIEFVNLERSNLGAIQNRLSHTVNNLSNIVENTSASRSRIEDADFATEAANLAKAQVLQQAGTAMLAQANAQSQIVLSLLG